MHLPLAIRRSGRERNSATLSSDVEGPLPSFLLSFLVSIKLADRRSVKSGEDETPVGRLGDDVAGRVRPLSAQAHFGIGLGGRAGDARARRSALAGVRRGKSLAHRK